MTVLFDAATARLRLTAEDWDALVCWCRGDTQTDGRMSALREAGVIDQGSLHPKLAPALDVVREPVVTFMIRQSDHRGHRIDGDAWAAPGAAAFLLDARDELRELVSSHSAMLPAMLARIVGLGPRDRGATEPLRVPDATLVRLLGPDVDARRAAVNELGHDGLHDAAEGPWNHWSIAAQWTSNRRRVIEVLDTTRQMWLIEHEAGRRLLRPTNPTYAWRLLSRLLPSDDELP